MFLGSVGIFLESYYHISRSMGPSAIHVVLRFVRLEEAKELCMQFGEAYSFKTFVVSAPGVWSNQLMVKIKIEKI